MLYQFQRLNLLPKSFINTPVKKAMTIFNFDLKNYSTHPNKAEKQDSKKVESNDEENQHERQQDQRQQQQHQHQQQQQQQNQNQNQQQNQQHQKQQQKSQSTFVPAVRDPFAAADVKSKNTYLAMVEIFQERDIHRRNHVEFIYAALKNMAEFGVEHDLEVYKALIDCMPKGKFIPTNIFQAEFMHYPKQQQCIIDLLEQMEDYGVIPDTEMEKMLLNVFGRRGHPLRKYWRMMYWMPKFKNLSPWPLPNPVPDLTLELAKLAVERMCSIDVQSHIDVFETNKVKDAIDDTWIVSGMSPEQSELLCTHQINKPLYIEGPFLIWLRNRSINYFTLRADPDVEFLKSFQDDFEDGDDVSNIKVPFFGKTARLNSKNELSKCRSVHQQDDGTIFAICATGTSTKDSLLSWIRILEANNNPVLGKIPVIFRFKSAVGDKLKEIEDVTSFGKSETDSSSNESNQIR